MLAAMPSAYQDGRQAVVVSRSFQQRQSVSGRIADQKMSEAVGIIALQHRSVRTEKLLADQGKQPLINPAISISKRQDRAAVKAPALNRPALEHRPLSGVELVEPGGQERLDARRNLNFTAGAVTDQCQHLLQEQGIALGHKHDTVPQLVGDTAQFR
jgi:hypothetical protein